MLTARRKLFQTLMVRVHEQPSSWLVSLAKDRNVPLISRVASLRELVWREIGTGLPYLPRRAIVRTKYGI